MPYVDLILDRVTGFIPVLLSLTVHECAHAWAAWKLGDDTAKSLGRVSLNPVDHIDPIGTLLLPLLGIPFGWAKPVPFNPSRFHANISMSFGTMLVAAAGPISNLILASIAFASLVAVTRLDHMQLLDGLDASTLASVAQLLQMLVIINTLLALFNLIPIPPLDGSQIVNALMPLALRPAWNQVMAMGPVLLIAVILMPTLLGFSILSWPIERIRFLLEWATST